MSYYAFIASDAQFDDVENPYITYLSINEALEIGLLVPDIVMNSNTVDRDNPNVLLYIDDEVHFGEITINKGDWGLLHNDNPITLEYISTLEWDYTTERAMQLITYIKKHLQKSKIVEVWCLWLGDVKESTFNKHIPISDLSPIDFEKMFVNNHVDEYVIKITV